MPQQTSHGSVPAQQSLVPSRSQASGTAQSPFPTKPHFEQSVPAVRSQPFPVRSLSTEPSFPTVPTETEPYHRSVPPSSIRGNGAGTALASPLCLPSWLASLRDRGIAIATTPNGPRLDGPLHLVEPTDGDQLTRHRHALELAAAGTHPDWWNHTAGLTDTVPTDDQLPHLDAATYPCATCGQPADWLDSTLLAWCEPHTDPQLIAGAAAWRRHG